MCLPAELWILDDGRIMAGGQLFALRLADAARNAGTPVRFAVPAVSPLATRARSRGFEVVPAEYPGLVPPVLWAMPGAVLRLRRLLAQMGPEAVVVGNTARCQAYATAALLGLGGAPPLVHLMQEQDSAQRLTARAVYRRFGTLVAVGDNTALAYRSRLPGVAVRQINNFVDGEEMQRMVAERRPPPGGDRPVVGVLGRMIKEKGIVELIEELARIPAAWRTVRIGAIEQDRRCADAVRAAITASGLGDRVQLLDEVRDLAAFFASIDVLVVPSTGPEAQPTVIIEGLLHGRPVVVRRAVWSPAFADLPVIAYEDVDQLASALATPLAAAPSVEELEPRFGAQQVLTALGEVTTSGDAMDIPDAGAAAAGLPVSTRARI